MGEYISCQSKGGGSRASEGGLGVRERVGVRGRKGGEYQGQGRGSPAPMDMNLLSSMNSFHSLAITSILPATESRGGVKDDDYDDEDDDDDGYDG